MRFMTGIVFGFVVVVAVNIAMITLAVSGADPVVSSYKTQAR